MIKCNTFWKYIGGLLNSLCAIFKAAKEQPCSSTEAGFSHILCIIVALDFRPTNEICLVLKVIDFSCIHGVHFASRVSSSASVAPPFLDPCLYTPGVKHLWCPGTTT